MITLFLHFLMCTSDYDRIVNLQTYIFQVSVQEVIVLVQETWNGTRTDFESFQSGLDVLCYQSWILGFLLPTTQ